MKVNRFERTALAIILGGILGCGHKDVVETLIEKQYPALQDCGSMKFISYAEQHKTKGAARRFNANGVVKWRGPWFRIETKCEAFHGLPAVVKVVSFNEMEKGVPFHAVFYKGRTDEKDEVTLDVPTSKPYTEKTLKKEMAGHCIIMPDGRMLGVKFDKKEFVKKRDGAIGKANEVVKLLDENMKVVRPKVDEILMVAFEGLNEDKLSEYINTIADLREEAGLHLDKVQAARSELDGFFRYPLPGLGQWLAKKCLDGLARAEETAKLVETCVRNRYDKAYAEREMRIRKGIKFVSGVRKTTGKTETAKTITLRNESVAVSDVEELTGDKQSIKFNSNRRQSQQRTRSIRAPKEQVPSPAPRGPITIRMPR